MALQESSMDRKLFIAALGLRVLAQPLLLRFLARVCEKRAKTTCSMMNFWRRDVWGVDVTPSKWALDIHHRCCTRVARLQAHTSASCGRAVDKQERIDGNKAARIRYRYKLLP